jgi:hypothetical protein
MYLQTLKMKEQKLSFFFSSRDIEKLKQTELTLNKVEDESAYLVSASSSYHLFHFFSVKSTERVLFRQTAHHSFALIIMRQKIREQFILFNNPLIS